MPSFCSVVKIKITNEQAMTDELRKKIKECSVWNPPVVKTTTVSGDHLIVTLEWEK